MRALLKLTWLEIKLFMREPINATFTLALPLIFLFVIGEVFGKVPAAEDVFRGLNAMDFYVPAYVGLVISSIGVIGLPVHLTNYREHGFLRRLRASSLPPVILLGSQVAVSFLLALMCCFLLFAAAMATTDISFPQSPLLLLTAFTISMLSFTALGFFLGAVLPTVRAAQVVGMLLFFVMFILSGGGPPPEAMSLTMQRIGKFLPLTHSVLLLQDSWNGFGWHMNASLVLAGMMVGTALLSLIFFRWE